jgi:hypothetical protein
MTREVESAGERNVRVTSVLLECASRFGLSSATEYAVPGGRIDVVWLWRATSPLPGVEQELPIVGFEIESSWRTRKHIKGDLLNLQDLRPLVGVIVLLGDGPEVESTRRFASQLVDRPGTRVVVWSEADVDALISGEIEFVELGAGEVSATTPQTPGVAPVQEHTGKYRPLWEWLRSRPDSPVACSFGDIERVLRFPLPPSSRRHPAHWYGYDNTAVGRAIRDAGWRARHVDLEAETVIFERSAS